MDLLPKQACQNSSKVCRWWFNDVAPRLRKSVPYQSLSYTSWKTQLNIYYSIYWLRNFSQMPSLCLSSYYWKTASQLFPGNVKKIVTLSAAYYFLLWPTEISDNPQANNMSKGTFCSRKMAGSSGTEQNWRYFLREKARNVGVWYRMTLSAVEVDEWSLSTEKWWNETYGIKLTFKGPSNINVLLSITNKMQRYTIFFITVNALYVSG
jgi:hypothetical protein